MKWSILPRWIAVVLLAAGCAAGEEYGADTAVDAPGDHTTWDSVADSGADTAVDPYADTVTDPGLDTAADTSDDTGLDSLEDPGPDPVTDPGVDPGWDSGFDPGWDPGIDWSIELPERPDLFFDPGLDYGFDPGWDPGFDPGIDWSFERPERPDLFFDPGWDFGFDPSTETAPDGPCSVRFCLVDPPRTCTDMGAMTCCSSDRSTLWICDLFLGRPIGAICGVGRCGPDTTTIVCEMTCL